MESSKMSKKIKKPFAPSQGLSQHMYIRTSFLNISMKIGMFDIPAIFS